jgi:hypothetical protein
MKKNLPRKKTWIGLAAELGYSRTALDTWRTLPKSPRTPSLALWRRFIKNHGLGIGGNSMSAARAAQIEQMNERRLRLADLEIERRESKTVLRSDAEGLNREIARRQRLVLTAALSEYASLVVGRTAVEARMVGRDLADRVCDVFTRPLDQWEWKPRMDGPPIP